MGCAVTSPGGSSGRVNRSVAAVLLAYGRLRGEDQDTFVRALNNYIRSDVQTKRALSETYAMQVDMGPTGRVCPTCGR